MKERRSFKAYLSGGMEFARNEGADWRREMEDWIRQNLSHGVYNPNRESELILSAKYPGGDFRKLKSQNRERFTQIVRDLVDIDCREIAHRSDYVICYWDESAQKGAGTKGEVTIARFLKKPVYMVTEMMPEEIPGWVLGCTTKIFGSFQELQTFLLQRFIAKRKSPK